MRAVLAFVMAVLALVCAGPAFAAELVAAPGTRIALAPPPGFAPATNFSGFTNKARSGSIAITEMSAASFPELRRRLGEPGYWTARGLTLVETGTLPGLPYDHILAQALRSQGDPRTNVWVVAFAHPELTGMVSVTLAQQAKPVLTVEATKALLAGVRVVAAPAGDPILLLPFAVDAPARFTYRKALAGRQLVLKETPPPPQGLESDVAVSIGLASQGPTKAFERDQILRQALYGLPAMRVETIADPALTTINGLAAMETTGEGRSSAGAPRRLYAVMIFGPKQAYLIYAVADPDRMRFAVDDLKKLARSFKAK